MILAHSSGVGLIEKFPSRGTCSIKHQNFKDQIRQHNHLNSSFMVSLLFQHSSLSLYFSTSFMHDPHGCLVEAENFDSVGVAALWGENCLVDAQGFSTPTRIVGAAWNRIHYPLTLIGVQDAYHTRRTPVRLIPLGTWICVKHLDTFNPQYPLHMNIMYLKLVVVTLALACFVVVASATPVDGIGDFPRAFSPRFNPTLKRGRYWHRASSSNESHQF
ncbi:hypothetical protein F5146DRAFT_1202900 [Armillaria mellea]|nr:hypothetical protein F5146DRAFT_1202900 [Armillaria mellea]